MWNRCGQKGESVNEIVLNIMLKGSCFTFSGQTVLYLMWICQRNPVFCGFTKYPFSNMRAPSFFFSFFSKYMSISLRYLTFMRCIYTPSKIHAIHHNLNNLWTFRNLEVTITLWPIRLLSLEHISMEGWLPCVISIIWCMCMINASKDRKKNWTCMSE